MRSFRTLFACAFFVIISVTAVAHAQDTSLLPKYGSAQKNEAQRSADAEFISTIDQQFGGNRSKAANEIALRGWQYLRQGNSQDAMRRFNQAWLLDSGNGTALWRMGAVSAATGHAAEALGLFSEANQTLADDIDFSVDYAKVTGVAGAESKNDALLQDAFSRFQRNYARAPQHTMNLQNWAITLFYVGKYADAWQKVQLAEATPGKAQLDPSFIAALQAKMPRP